MTHQFFVPESAMAIVAHPDDIEFGCVGTLARWARAGARICYVLCTSGDVGIADTSITRQEAAEIREKESLEAARIAGVSDVVFLHEPDGLLQATLELRKKLVREIRRFKPEVVLCNDPTVLFPSDDYINHPDHRAAGQAALDAVFPAAGQPHLFQELEKEGLQAFKPCKVYVMSWSNGAESVSIDETIAIKVAALRAHKSQMKEWDPEEDIKKWAAERAKGKEMTYAETFRVIVLVNEEECLEKKRAR